MLTIIFFAVLEMLKRPLFLILYPFAYRRRSPVRAAAVGGRPTRWERVLYWALDDSIVADSIRRGAGPLDYCCYGKRSALVEKLPAGKFQEFMRAYYWSAFRNSAINLMIITEYIIGTLQFTPIKYIFAWRTGGFFAGVYEIRKFKKLRLPYLEAWAGGWRFQAGWLSCGRWQIQFRNLGIDKRPDFLI